jgi:predicted phosphodiesterase
VSLTEFAESSESDRLEARIDDLKSQLARTRGTLASLERENDALRQIAEVAQQPLKPPKWLRPKKRAGQHTATVCTILSDCHFDEVVNPSELGGRNAYDRHIAELRLERYFQGVVKLSSDYLAGMTYDGCVLMLGGDLISGDIHEELSESNEGTALETVLHWSSQLAAGVSMLADQFGAVHLPCVVGNHGRRTRKPRAKRRARDNFDWLICQMLANHFAADARVTFDIPDGTDALVPVYDTKFLLTHGDQVGGGGGIGGIWPPIMRMVAKKRVRHEFDALICGHWHQLIMAPTAGLIVNGSLKGEDEYAAVSNFAPERAQQAMWIVAPHEGVTFSSPVFADDAKAEGWA